MTFVGPKLRTIAIAGAIFALIALGQSAAADPDLQQGSYGGGPIGKFSIPSVAQGHLFYLDGYGSPTEITAVLI